MTVIGGGEEGKKEINFSFKDRKYCLPAPGSALTEKFAESHVDSVKEQSRLKSQIPKPHFLPSSMTYRENFTKLQKYGTPLQKNNLIGNWAFLQAFMKPFVK